MLKRRFSIITLNATSPVPLQTNPDQLRESVQLLLQLGQPADALCSRVIAHAQRRLAGDLSQLTNQVELARSAADAESHDQPAELRLNVPKVRLFNGPTSAQATTRLPIKMKCLKVPRDRKQAACA